MSDGALGIAKGINDINRGRITTTKSAKGLSFSVVGSCCGPVSSTLERGLTRENRRYNVDLGREKSRFVAFPDPLKSDGGEAHQNDHGKHHAVHARGVSYQHDRDPATDYENGRVDPEPLGNGLQLLKSGGGE